MARDRIHVRCFGTAFVAWYVLATVSMGIADAAMKEEVARCRAIEQRTERLDCFKALKQSAPAKTEGAVPANPEGTPTKREDGAAGDATKTQPKSVEPATTSINRLSAEPGQPVCVDRDAGAHCRVAHFKPKAGGHTRLPDTSFGRQTGTSRAASRRLSFHANGKGESDVSYKAGFVRRLHHRDGTFGERRLFAQVAAMTWRSSLVRRPFYYAR